MFPIVRPWRRAHIILLGLLFAAPTTAVAQTIPGVNTPFGGLTRTIAGIDVINAQIADLRRELSRCDGPGASKTGICASRALLQAKLNYLLEVSMMLGDPDTAGAPPPKPAEKPADTSNYEVELAYLRQQLSQEPRGGYAISENRAKVAIINHCKVLQDHYTLMALQTDEENRAVQEDERTGRTKARVNACIKEYDAKEIAANHTAAVEYCLPATTDQYGARPLMNLCMHKHDMLTALCKQEIDFMGAMQQHKNPGGQRAYGVCPADRVFIGPAETQTIMAAPRVRTMAALPPKFVAPPDVAIAPRPPLPIPAGTVIELKIAGTWDGFAIDNVENGALAIPAVLDRPLVVGGQTVLQGPASAFLKGRIVGASSRFEARPATVQIAFTIDEINIDAPDCRPCGKWADLKSNEVVFTVPYTRTATNQGVMFDTRIRFTIGASGIVEAPSTQTPASGQRGAAPPTSAAPPQTPAAPAPAASDPQQRAEEARQRAARIQACVQQAIRDNPTGGLAVSQAIAACGQIK